MVAAATMLVEEEKNMYTAVYGAMALSARKAGTLCSSSVVSAPAEARISGVLGGATLEETFGESRFFGGEGGARGGARRRVALERPLCLACGSGVVFFKCESCAIFDRGGGYYCKRCFPKRHPEHRSPHAWSQICESEDLRYALQFREGLAEGDALMEDAKRARDSLERPTQAIRTMNRDYKAHDMIKRAVRTDLELSKRLTSMRCALNGGLGLDDDDDDDVALVIRKGERKKQTPLALWALGPDHAAAALLQRNWRAHRRSSQNKTKNLQMLYQKHVDDDSGYYYFVNLMTNDVSWEPPHQLWADTKDQRAAMHRAANLILTPRSYDATYGSPFDDAAVREEEKDFDKDLSSEVL